MSASIRTQDFLESEGVEDWRVIDGQAHASFATGSFAKGVVLVDAIAVLADAADHHPDIDLRYSRVTVRLMSHDIGTLSMRDVELARSISRAARHLGIESDPKDLGIVKNDED